MACPRQQHLCWDKVEAMLVPLLLGVGVLGALALVPSRAEGAQRGSEGQPPVDFVRTLLSVGDARREQWIEQALFAHGGAAIPHPASFLPVTVSGGGHQITFYVAPDYVAVPTPQGPFRVPMRPALAQRVADAVGAHLPTPRMVDAIYAQAPVKVGFVALTPRPGEHQDSSRLYVEHQLRTEARRGNRAGLVAGHKKDLVVGNLLGRAPNKVLIYGAWYPDGTKVQPYSNVHDDHYVDYSHGVRLVASEVLVDGMPRALVEVLRDPTLAPLLSHEGRVQHLRYGREPPR